MKILEQIQSKVKGKIPARTMHAIANPESPGGRHDQALSIAGSLRNCGANAEDIFELIRSIYDKDFPDEEIAEIIKWVADKGGHPLEDSKPPTVPSITSEEPSRKEKVEKLLDGYCCSEQDLFKVSPVELPKSYERDFIFLLEHLYNEGERLNVVFRSDEDVNANGIKKARPHGRGETRTLEDWVDRIETRGLEKTKAGGWFRINPVDREGIADKNVTAFRYMLFEMDSIPMDLQLSLIVRKLPSVAAIIDSGGRSYHAIVKLDCASLQEYRQIMDKIDWDVLSRCLGVDRANRNPSRLSRLPGAFRVIGAREEDGVNQILIYLNPNPDPEKTISETHSI